MARNGGHCSFVIEIYFFKKVDYCNVTQPKGNFVMVSMGVWTTTTTTTSQRESHHRMPNGSVHVALRRKCQSDPF